MKTGPAILLLLGGWLGGCVSERDVRCTTAAFIAAADVAGASLDSEAFAGDAVSIVPVDATRCGPTVIVTVLVVASPELVDPIANRVVFTMTFEAKQFFATSRTGKHWKPISSGCITCEKLPSGSYAKFEWPIRDVPSVELESLGRKVLAVSVPMMVNRDHMLLRVRGLREVPELAKFGVVTAEEKVLVINNGGFTSRE